MNNRLLPAQRPLVLMLGAILTLTLVLVLSTVSRASLGPMGFGSSAVLAEATTSSTDAEDTTSSVADDTGTTAEETTTTVAESSTTVAEDTTTTVAETSSTTALDSDSGAAPTGGAETGAGGTADSGNTVPIAIALGSVLVLSAGALFGVRRLTAS